MGCAEISCIDSAHDVIVLCFAVNKAKEQKLRRLSEKAYGNLLACVCVCVCVCVVYVQE